MEEGPAVLDACSGMEETAPASAAPGREDACALLSVVSDRTLATTARQDVVLATALRVIDSMSWYKSMRGRVDETRSRERFLTVNVADVDLAPKDKFSQFGVVTRSELRVT